MSSAPALTRGLHILELVKEKEELSYKQIQKLTGINSSSLSRILNVLINNGYLEKNNNKNYIIGTKLLLFAKGSSLELLSQKAEDTLNEITQKFNVTTCLHGYTNKGSIMLNKKIDPDNVALRGIGTIIEDFILGPWGFLYVAEKECPLKFIKKVKKNKWYNIPPPSNEKLMELIEEAKQKGYGDDKGIIIKGIRKLAVPIYNSNNNLIASLGIGTMQELINEEDVEEIINFLKLQAQQLASKIQVKNV